MLCIAYRVVLTISGESKDEKGPCYAPPVDCGNLGGICHCSAWQQVGFSVATHVEMTSSVRAIGVEEFFTASMACDPAFLSA